MQACASDMRRQKSDVILKILHLRVAEFSARGNKGTKAGMIAFRQQLAIHNAEFGIRANAIVPD
jgi:NAD(P)-dependent dehydrogenase (short-subunit alcohol dehydrogenase family)